MPSLEVACTRLALIRAQFQQALKITLISHIPLHSPAVDPAWAVCNGSNGYRLSCCCLLHLNSFSLLSAALAVRREGELYNRQSKVKKKLYHFSFYKSSVNYSHWILSTVMEMPNFLLVSLMLRIVLYSSFFDRSSSTSTSTTHRILYPCTWNRYFSNAVDTYTYSSVCKVHEYLIV